MLDGGGISGNMEQMLAMLLEDTRYFRIGDKQYEFHDKDNIFTIDRPSAKKENLMANGKCMSCDSIFKSSKVVCYW